MLTNSLKLLIQERLRAKIFREDVTDNSNASRPTPPSSLHPEILDTLVICKSNLKGEILASSASTAHKLTKTAPEVDDVLHVSNLGTYLHEEERVSERTIAKYRNRIFRDNPRQDEFWNRGSKACLKMDSSSVVSHPEAHECIGSNPADKTKITITTSGGDAGSSVATSPQPASYALRFKSKVSSDSTLHSAREGTKRKADAEILSCTIQGSAVVSCYIKLLAPQP
uniref:AlNc14C48G3824 protein n=1 Tax=Albugo laibachii Nc14 TaxID=890382 RepID=F0WAW2_9STRA|nr:AlNc14C48G3824 [Albugo laibachii Nc14]|eukprot:CCA18284.1 AlNc14C48G3824 [Albugo laibachii Nc14]